MAKKAQRADKIKTQAKVIGAIISDPLADQRTIAKKAWVSKTSVHNHLKDIDQTWPKSLAIDNIIKKDVEIVNLAQAELQRRLEEDPKKISTKDIISAGDVSAKRYSLFKWKATDEEWGLEQAITITWMN